MALQIKKAQRSMARLKLEIADSPKTSASRIRRKNMKQETFDYKILGEMTVINNGNHFLFLATECAKVLDYTNPERAIRMYCENATQFNMLHSRQKNKALRKAYLTESNLYSLVMNNKLPQARAWVCAETLSSICKTGGYVMPGREEEFFEKHYAFLAPETMKQALKEIRGHAITLEMNRRISK